MKKHIVLVGTLFMSASTLAGTDACKQMYPVTCLVGQKAPEFTAKAAVVDDIQDVSLAMYGKKYKVLIFYPGDFSYICPTELLAFQEKMSEFEKHDAQLIGVSVDQVYSHLAWLNMPKKKGGIKGVSFPLIGDVSKEVSCKYMVLNKEGVALRAVFVIDPDNVVQSMTIYNTKFGRSVDEVLRSLEADKECKTKGKMCPVNWKPGKKTIAPTKEGAEVYFGNAN